MAQIRGGNYTNLGGQGTVSMTAGSNVITGGTDDEGLYPDWRTAEVGDYFMLGNDSPAFFQISYVDAQSVPPTIQLTTNYPATITDDDDWIVTTDFTPNASLPLVNQGDLYFASINERQMTEIDALINGGLTYIIDVISRTNAAPSSGISDGDSYLIIGSVSSGDAWYGQENNVAVYDGTSGVDAWTFTVPESGNYVYSVADNKVYAYFTDTWREWPALTLSGLTSLTVDNITLDGNTISTSTGDLILSPNGTSDVQISADIKNSTGNTVIDLTSSPYRVVLPEADSETKGLVIGATPGTSPEIHTDAFDNFYVTVGTSDAILLTGRSWSDPTTITDGKLDAAGEIDWGSTAKGGTLTEDTLGYKLEPQTSSASGYITGNYVDIGLGTDDSSSSFRIYNSSDNKLLDIDSTGIITILSISGSTSNLFNDGLGNLATDSSFTLNAGDLDVSVGDCDVFGNITSDIGLLVLTTSKAPATAASTGTVGSITWDADYIYVCTASNTWKRASIATW